MNFRKTTFGALAATGLIAGALIAQPAAAQHFRGGGWHGGWHGGWGVGVVVAPGYWGPGYWGPGWGYWGYPGAYYDPYYYPAAAVAPSYAPTYVERSDAPAANTQSGAYYWYRCDNPSGYYPYVKQCPSGWERVAPQPPAAPQ